MKVKASKLEDAIIKIAKHFGLEEAYIYMLDRLNLGYPSVVREIIYQMFINEFHPDTIPEDLKESYEYILEYSKALHNIGFVNFES